MKSVTSSTDSASRTGGLALYEKRGAEHMRRIGAKGRATVQEKYGLRFYSEIARRKRRTPVVTGEAKAETR
jgi:hypothetical protein